MMRTMLESLVSVRQSSQSTKMKLDSHSAELIERFHKESLNYKHMLSFSRTGEKQNWVFHSLFSVSVTFQRYWKKST